MTADDYFAIQNLINDYFQRVDAGDFDGCGALFSDADMHYTASGTTFTNNPKAVADQMRSYVKLYGDERTPLTRHHSGNIIINPAGQKSAKAKCSAVIFQSTPDFTFKAIAEASYDDQFKKVNGNWKFSRRELSLNFIGDMSHHLIHKV